jgi:hypothetical protein
MENDECAQTLPILTSVVLTLQENNTYASIFLNSTVPRNITHIYSSVPKPTKVNEVDECMPGMFID